MEEKTILNLLKLSLFELRVLAKNNSIVYTDNMSRTDILDEIINKCDIDILKLPEFKFKEIPTKLEIKKVDEYIANHEELNIKSADTLYLEDKLKLDDADELYRNKYSKIEYIFSNSSFNYSKIAKGLVKETYGAFYIYSEAENKKIFLTLNTAARYNVKVGDYIEGTINFNLMSEHLFMDRILSINKMPVDLYSGNIKNNPYIFANLKPLEKITLPRTNIFHNIDFTETPRLFLLKNTNADKFKILSDLRTYILKSNIDTSVLSLVYEKRELFDLFFNVEDFLKLNKKNYLFPDTVHDMINELEKLRVFKEHIKRLNYFGYNTILFVSDIEKLKSYLYNDLINLTNDDVVSEKSITAFLTEFLNLDSNKHNSKLGNNISIVIGDKNILPNGLYCDDFDKTFKIMEKSKLIEEL